MTRALPRRKFLRGMAHGGLVTVGVPTLNAMLNGNGTAYAQGQPLPVRYGGLFCGHGFAYRDFSMQAGSDFIPAVEGTGNGWSLPSGLAAFAPLKDAMSYIKGITAGATGHSQVVLTGYPALAEGTKGFLRNPHLAAEPSIDQIIASAIGANDPLRSLEMGVCTRANDGIGPMTQAMSFPGRGLHNPPIYDPRQVFNKVFGNFIPADASPAEKARQALGASVLDVVREGLKSLQTVVGPEDRRRLDLHTESIRSVEKTLASPPGPTCGGVPGRPTNTYSAPAHDDEQQLKYVNQTMGKLVALALACNRTRVFTHLFSKDSDYTHYKWLGATENEHATTHGGSADALGGSKAIQVASVKWRMQRLAEFVQEIKVVPGAAGKSLLDSCAILYTSTTQGGFHLPLNMPVIIFGNLNGKMKTNFYHWAKVNDIGTGKTNISNVFLTIARLMGVKLDKLGPAKDYAIPGKSLYYGYGSYGAPDQFTQQPNHNLVATQSMPALVA